ncbi:hypothetical protein K438DRAFT_537825 [Mycena galopus ATCC 62051]|nr:hypothetical protein K438DRAFT_537825 [Mycena galopus ATCC 62051]
MVNSLYRKKKILIGILVFFLCSAAGVITIIMRSIGTSRASVCDPASHDSRFGEIWAFWVPILAFETFLFMLALIQLGRNVGVIRKNALLFQSKSHLIELILRDSMWYFLLAWLTSRPSLYGDHPKRVLSLVY